MATNKARFSALIGFVVLGLAPMFGGCGNALAPGDYRIYKMEFQRGSQSGGCFYPSTEPDPNTKSDSDSTLTSATWVMTTDASGNYFLDLGANTLQGKETDTGLQFTATKVDVQFDMGDASQTKRTTTVSATVDVTIDGKSIGGKGSTTTSFGCSGTACMNVPPSCTVTQAFSGTEVDDVQLQYPVK
jgi:hypothetical protein